MRCNGFLRRCSVFPCLCIVFYTHCKIFLATCKSCTSLHRSCIERKRRCNASSRYCRASFWCCRAQHRQNAPPRRHSDKTTRVRLEDESIRIAQGGGTSRSPGPRSGPHRRSIPRETHRASYHFPEIKRLPSETHCSGGVPPPSAEGACRAATLRVATGPRRPRYYLPSLYSWKLV